MKVMLVDILLAQTSHMSKLRVSVGREMGENLPLYKSIEARRTDLLEMGDWERVTIYHSNPLLRNL